jgi:hypothetical protein
VVPVRSCQVPLIRMVFDEGLLQENNKHDTNSRDVS